MLEFKKKRVCVCGGGIYTVLKETATSQKFCKPVCLQNNILLPVFLFLCLKNSWYAISMLLRSSAAAQVEEEGTG